MNTESLEYEVFVHKIKSTTLIKKLMMHAHNEHYAISTLKRKFFWHDWYDLVTTEAESVNSCDFVLR